MTDTAPTTSKIRNVTGHEHCAACIDGWVELAGTTLVHGVEYTHGWAPCKWCEQGAKRYAHVADGPRRYQPETDFTGTDIIPHSEEPGPRFTPTAQWLRDHGWRGSTPVIQSIGAPDAAEIRRRRALALQAKNEAEQEGSP